MTQGQASGTGTAAAANNDNPDTMKRIQQILDDYNQQIRNSPDLQTKPAPRRRIPVVAASPSSGGTSPNVKTTVKNNNGKESETTTVREEQQATAATSNGGQQQQQAVRQIVMPSSLAAQLAASGRQIVVVTGPGGQKMVALKPITPQSTPPTPQTGLSRGQPVSTAITLKPEPVVSPVGLSVVSGADSGLSSQATVIVPPTSNSSGVSSGVAAELSPPPSSRQSDSGHATLSASPTQTVNLNVQTDEQDDHPDGVGSPLGTLAMEMTPGQMMEAEMSASGCLLDDVMMGPTGSTPQSPDTTDLLMSGLTDEPLFSGFPTSSASGPSGSGGPSRHSSLFNLYCGEDDESESDHVNGFGVGLGGPSGVGSTGGHHHHQPPPVQATETTFNAAAMPPSVGTLGNTSSTDDDDTSSPGSAAAQSDTSSGTVVHHQKPRTTFITSTGTGGAVTSLVTSGQGSKAKGKRRAAMSPAAPTPSPKRARKPTVKIIEATQQSLPTQVRKMPGNTAKTVIRG